MSTPDPFASYLRTYGGAGFSDVRGGGSTTRAPSFGQALREIARGAGGVARQVGRGLAESGQTTLEGGAAVGRLLDQVPGAAYFPVTSGLVQGARSEDASPHALADARFDIQRTYGEPTSGVEVGSQIAGRLAGDVAQFMAPGAGASRAGLLPEIAGGGLRGMAARTAVNTAVTAPVTVAQAGTPAGSSTAALADLTGNETLQRLASTVPGRVAGDLGLDVLAGGAVEGIIGGAKAAAPALRRVLTPTERGRAIGARLAEDVRAGRVDLNPPPPAPPMAPAPAPVSAVPAAAAEPSAGAAAASLQSASSVHDDLFDLMPTDAFMAANRYVTEGGAQNAAAAARAVDEVPGLRERITTLLRGSYGDRIPVYRAGGVTPGAPQSWTTDPAIARSLANFDDAGRPAHGARAVVQAEVSPDRVLFPGSPGDSELILLSPDIPPGQSLAAEGAAAREAGTVVPLSMDDPRLMAVSPAAEARVAAAREAEAAQAMMFRGAPNPQSDVDLRAAADPALVDALARGGVGGVVGGAAGAALDDEDPTRGFALGAGAGALGGALGPAVARYLAERGGDLVHAVAPEARAAPDLAATRVLDEAGAPRVVYHGTGSGFHDFEPVAKEDANSLQYGPGYYFTESPETANTYAKPGGTVHTLREELDGYRRDLADPARAPTEHDRATLRDMIAQGEWTLANVPLNEGGPSVRPARLAIHRPFDIDAPVDPSEAERLIHLVRGQVPSEAMGRLAAPGATNEDLYWALSSTSRGKLGATETLREAGYDGITHIGGGPSGSPPHRVWIAFDRPQIRSAFGPAEDAAQAGFAHPGLLRGVAQAGAGAAAGAYLDDENPGRGALTGAAFGALATPGSWERLASLRGGVAEAVWNRSPTVGRIVFTHDRLPADYRAAKGVLRRATSEAQMVAAEIAARARTYPEQVQRLMSEIADSGAPHEEVVRRLAAADVANPEDAAGLIRDAHELFGGMAEDLFGLGMLSRESIEKHGGRYLPRYYRAGTEGAGGVVVGRSPLPMGARTELDANSLGRLAQRSEEVSPEMAARRVDDFGFRATAGALQEGKLVAGERFFQTVRAMDEVTHPQFRAVRDQLAEARTAEAAIPRSAGAERLAAHDEIEALQRQMTEAETVARDAGFVKLDDSPKLGSLRGMYVSPEVAEDLAGLTAKRGVMGDAVDFYDRWYRRWKAGKTVLNPATHFRNIYGAQMLSWMGGGPAPFGSSYQRAWGIVRKTANPRAMSPAQEAIYREARAHGLFDSGAMMSEVETPKFRRGFAVNAPGGDAAELAGEASNALGRAKGIPRRLYDKAARLYANEDIAARLAHYLHQRAKGLDPAEAAALASKWVPQFHEQSNLVKAWSRVVPFFGYTAAALPRVAEAAATHPARFLAAGALTYGLGNLLYDSDVPDEILPNEMRSGATGGLLPRFLPLPGGEGGKRNYLDFTYVMPWGDIGESKSTGYGPASSLPGQLNILSNPLIGTGAQLLLNKDRLTGREITRLSDTPWEEAKKTGDYLVKQALPSLTPGPSPGADRTGGGWGYAALHDAITGKPNFRGDVRSIPETVAGTIFGLKNRSIDPEEEYGRRRDEIHKELSDARSAMRRVQRDQGASQRAKREAREDFRKKAERLNGMLEHLGEVHRGMVQGQASPEAPAADADADPFAQYRAEFGERGHP